MPVSKPGFPRSQTWLDGLVDTLNAAETTASNAANTAATASNGLASRPTTEQVAETITTALGPYATDAEVTAAVDGVKVIVLGANDPLPAGTGAGRLIARLSQATLTLTKQFGKSATALADTASVTTSTAAPSTFSEISGTVAWSQAKGGLVFPAGTTARWVKFLGLTGTLHSVGVAFKFGNPGDSWSAAAPSSGASFIYGQGDQFRVTLNSSGAPQLRNPAGTTFTTGSALTPGTWYYAVVTHTDTTQSTTALTIYNLSTGATVFTASGVTATTPTTLTGVIYGQQSTLSLGLELTMYRLATAVTDNGVALMNASAA